jgi:hypothetical protein
VSHVGTKVCFGLTPALPFGFTLTPATFAGRLTPLLEARREKVLGFEQLTDGQLDAAFALPPKESPLLGDRAVRLALLRALVRYPRLRIANGVLELRARATEEILSIELELMLRHGLSVARALRDAAGAMPEVEQLQAGASLPEVTT